MNGRLLNRKFKRVFVFCSKLLTLFPYRFRLWLFVLFRNVKGHIGIAIRYILIMTLAKKCGDNVCIKEGVYIYNLKELSLGNNVSIHPLCYIDAIGGIFIGDNVSIAHNSSLISFDHAYETMELPIKYNPLNCKPIIIKDDVWIGCGVRILSGTEINKRVIVGAGAVAKGVLKEHSIYVGIPAKSVKNI